MDLDVIGKYSITWVGKGEELHPPRSEIRAFKKALRNFPLNIVPRGEGLIEYYPNGGCGSAAIPHLIRFDCEQGMKIIEPDMESILKTEDSNSKKVDELVEFIFLTGKGLRLKYDKFTIEILSEKPSGDYEYFRSL